MSACKDKTHRDAWWVSRRNCNYSSFNKGGFAISDYSQIWCEKCPTTWRSKAKYVDTLPDLRPVPARTALGAPVPTIEHQPDEYVVNAPDGYRFAGLECHQLVIAYGDEGLTQDQGYRDALEERRVHALEACPGDCPCMEIADFEAAWHVLDVARDTTGSTICARALCGGLTNRKNLVTEEQAATVRDVCEECTARRVGATPNPHTPRTP